MLTLRELTQNKLLVEVSEELQSGIEFMEDSPGGNKASLGAAWRGRPPGRIVSRTPLAPAVFGKVRLLYKGIPPNRT